MRHGGLPAGTGTPFLVGTVTAAVAGFFAAWFLFSYVRSHSLRPFVWYRFALGVVVLVVIAIGLRGATGI